MAACLQGSKLVVGGEHQVTSLVNPDVRDQEICFYVFLLQLKMKVVWVPRSWERQGHTPWGGGGWGGWHWWERNPSGRDGVILLCTLGGGWWWHWLGRSPSGRDGVILPYTLGGWWWWHWWGRSPSERDGVILPYTLGEGGGDTDGVAVLVGETGPSLFHLRVSLVGSWWFSAVQLVQLQLKLSEISIMKVNKEKGQHINKQYYDDGYKNINIKKWILRLIIIQ